MVGRQLVRSPRPIREDCQRLWRSRYNWSRSRKHQVIHSTTTVSMHHHSARLHLRKLVCYTEFGEGCRLLEECANNATHHVWRRHHSADDLENTMPTVRFRGGSGMLWVCLSFHGTSRIQIIEGKTNGAINQDIIEKNLLQWDTWPSRRTTIQNILQRRHYWLKTKKIQMSEWPSQLRDLNPVGNCPRNWTQRFASWFSWIFKIWGLFA